MRKNAGRPKRIAQTQKHDIKLELDIRCQKVIEKTLRSAFPMISILGEEGGVGKESGPSRWVVDPIDGTVNFTYGIPHACVSIALQTRVPHPLMSKTAAAQEEYETMLGVVYDPFCEETWTAIRGQSARLNGRLVRASDRQQLGETIISVGFAKEAKTLDQILPIFNHLIRRVRKVRIMGAAALGLVYVASGRLDAYIEAGLRLWDIAAGGLILECAGGEFWRRPVRGEHAYQIIASNGRLRRKLYRACPGLKDVFGQHDSSP